MGMPAIRIARAMLTRIESTDIALFLLFLCVLAVVMVADFKG